MEKAISSDLIRGHIDTIILHALINGDKFAQQIADYVSEKSEKKYELNQATLYSSLKRLETLKLVVGYWHDSENGRRRYFKITEDGKNTVENNLSNWSYSRAIIDKLMDFEAPGEVRTEYIEKIVTVPVEKIIEVPVEKIVEVPISIPTQPQVLQENLNETDKIDDKTEISSENIQEINFRNILNGLISSTKPAEKPENKKIEIVDPIDNNTDVINNQVKFSETLDLTNYNDKNKSNNNGKIDFGDLTQIADAEGYKIRISSKEPVKKTGFLLSNKINLFAILVLFPILLIEYLIFTSISSVQFSTTLKIISIAIILLLPLTFLALYAKNPLKTTTKNIGKDGVLTCGIVVFNLILVTFALNLFFDVDFGVLFNLISYFIIPLCIYLDIFGYFALRYAIANNKKINVKLK